MHWRMATQSEIQPSTIHEHMYFDYDVQFSDIDRNAIHFMRVHRDQCHVDTGCFLHRQNIRFHAFCTHTLRRVYFFATP